MDTVSKWDRIDNRALAEELADYIMLIGTRVSIELLPKLNQENITYMQFLILSYIAHGDNLTMWEIAKKMGKKDPSATGLVKKLEKLGYLESKKSDQDYRKTLVHITRKGRELIQWIEKEMKTHLSKIDAEESQSNQPG